MAVGDLTDKQLVDELRNYGENITLPLKSGRREILIKKLNHLRFREKGSESPKKKSGQTKTKTLDTFSSDDSDVDRSTKVSTSTRRRSAAITRPSTTTSVDSIDDDGFKRPTPRRSRRSEPVVPLSKSLSFPSSSKQNSSFSQDTVDFLNRRKSGGQSKYSGNSFYEFDKSLETDDDAEPSMYEVANKSVNTSLPYQDDDDDEEEDDDDDEQGYILTRSRSKPSTSASKRSAGTTLSSFRHEYPTPTRKSLSYSRPTYNTSISAKPKKKKSFYPDQIPEGLLVVVILFFVCLVAGYMFIKSDSVLSLYDGVFYNRGPRAELLLCEDMDEEQQLTERCYAKDEVDKSLIIIHDLYDLLSTRAGEVECGTAVDKDMTADDFRQILKDMKHKRKEVLRLFNASVDHIIKNPHWKLRVFTDEGKLAARPDEVATLESTVSSKSLSCRIGQSFNRVLSSIIIFIIVCGCIYFGYHWLRYQSKKSDVEQHKVYKMVDDIIDILKERCDNNDEKSVSYMAVQHVRDQLLPPFKRRELQPIWDKAVKFIEANESRIRLESQIIQGEEFEVWRWIQTSPNGGKLWQGQAFGEHNDTATSSLKYSPTPCLKVKNMFDMAVESDEDWYEKVENAILEKTEGVADVIHMYVDEESKEGCVYIKCSSREEAGKARQCLHGWWFDGRLVTARYLRLEHYHKQFPESVRATRPLRLQKQQRSSLRQPYFRSTLEMT